MIKPSQVSKKVQYAQIALSMSGIGIDYRHTDLVLSILEKMEEMGNKFDLETVAKLRAENDKKYNKLEKEKNKKTCKNR